ncbi:MAG: DUF2752 domain-containing protein [Alistipes sp.]|nr:DUF2752 domain-containing protein [Alistipes sp.]
MPKCIFHLLTGWDCPACGIQRAFHSLLHGELILALRYNYFLIFSIPYFVVVAITTFLHGESIIAMRRYVQHPTIVKLFLYMTILWWVVRNIPWCKTFMGML